MVDDCRWIFAQESAVATTKVKLDLATTAVRVTQQNGRDTTQVRLRDVAPSVGTRLIAETSRFGNGVTLADCDAPFTRRWRQLAWWDNVSKTHGRDCGDDAVWENSDSEDHCGEDKHDETIRCGHVQRQCTETTERDDETKGRTRVVGCFFEERGRSGRKKA